MGAGSRCSQGTTKIRSSFNEHYGVSVRAPSMVFRARKNMRISGSGTEGMDGAGDWNGSTLTVHSS